MIVVMDMLNISKIFIIVFLMLVFVSNAQNASNVYDITQSFENDTVVKLALGYILSCQNDDGGFGSEPEAMSDIKSTAIAVIALASLGEDPGKHVRGNHSPVSYLIENQEAINNMTSVEAQYGRYVVALVSAGLNPYDVNGSNYVELLRGYCDPSGEIGKRNYIWDDCWVMLGLISSGDLSGMDTSINHLKSLQTSSGGWAWNGGSDMADVDTTAIVLCTLLAGGVDRNSTAVQNGLQYLRSEQNRDGGFSLLGSNAASDGWAIMALNAAGENPRKWCTGSSNPIDHLKSLQKDDGSIWWKEDVKGMSFEWTANAIIALTGGSMPPVIYK